SAASLSKTVITALYSRPCWKRSKTAWVGLPVRSTNLLHYFDDVGIEGAGLEAGAFCFKEIAAVFFQKGFGHLAAGGVVEADKEDFVFCVHGLYINIAILRWVESKKFSRYSRVLYKRRIGRRIPFDK